MWHDVQSKCTKMFKNVQRCVVMHKRRFNRVDQTHFSRKGPLCATHSHICSWCELGNHPCVVSNILRCAKNVLRCAKCAKMCKNVLRCAKNVLGYAKTNVPECTNAESTKIASSFFSEGWGRGGRCLSAVRIYSLREIVVFCLYMWLSIEHNTIGCDWWVRPREQSERPLIKGLDDSFVVKHYALWHVWYIFGRNSSRWFFLWLL